MTELTAPVVKADDEKRIVSGPVLIPDEPDSDGDVVKTEQIENVAHKFVEQYGNIDLQHSLNNVGKMVESYIAPADLNFDESITVPKGSWMMGVRVTDDETWKSVKSGGLTGFSIMGISKAATKAEKAASEKRTTLNDLGEDFIVNAVSLVDEPAVPKAKWVAVKSQSETDDKASKGFMDKVKGLFSGSVTSEKAGRKISDSNYNALQNAKETIESLLQVASDERTEKNKGEYDMNEQEVKDLVAKEMKPVTDKMDEVLNTLKSEGNTDTNQSQGNQQQSQQSSEGNQQGGEGNQEPNSQGTGNGEGQQGNGQGAGKSQDDKDWDAILKSLQASQPVSKRIAGQDETEQAEKNKPAPKRDAFGRKINKEK